MANNLPALAALQGEIMSTRMAEQLHMALPDHIPVEKFQRVVVTAVNKNPALVGAERRTLFTSCIECASDGLVPNGKEAALVMFGQNVVYMPMIAGIYKRARNSGEVTTLNGQVVHANDVFDYAYGFEPTLSHKPAIGERGDIVAVYAVAVMRDGTRDMEIMSVDEVEAVRATSRAKDSGPWKTWWGEMAKKTVVRRLAKRLPLTGDLERLIQRVDDLYDLSDAKPEDAEVPRPTQEDYSAPWELYGPDGEVIETHPNEHEWTDSVVTIIEDTGRGADMRLANADGIARLGRVDKPGLISRINLVDVGPTETEVTPAPAEEEEILAEQAEAAPENDQAPEPATSKPAPETPVVFVWRSANGHENRYPNIGEWATAVKRAVGRSKDVERVEVARINNQATMSEYLALGGDIEAVVSDVQVHLQTTIEALQGEGAAL
jgi:phage RecT family recombinase